jgi:hypothetical protein
MIIKSLKLHRLAVFFLALALVGCSSGSSTSKNTITIDSLKIGDKVIDTTWNWEFLRGYGYTSFGDTTTESVIWIVVAKDHYGSGMTLMTENIIADYYFDGSTLSNGMLAGQNHWGNSGSTSAYGLRPWLNSETPHEDTGFYKAFSTQFKSVVLTTDVPNRKYDDGSTYTTQDKVFIPSNTELGDTTHTSTYEIGTIYNYFIGKDRFALEANFPNQSTHESYWTRSPIIDGYRVEGMVTDSSWFVNNFADFNSIGVRAVVNVNNSTLVSDKVNEDGLYEIKYAQ